MSRDRDSIGEIEEEPSFTADSLTIPEELRDNSNFGNPARPRSETVGRPARSSWPLWICLIAGSAVLGVMAAVLLRSDSSVETPAVVALAVDAGINPKIEKSVTKVLVPKPVEPAQPPPVEKKVDPPAPVAHAKPSVNAPRAKPTKRKRRKKPRRSLDDALAKLQEFKEEPDPSPQVDGMQSGGDRPQGAAAMAPNAACAQGDVSACVKAGRAAEAVNDGAKARQFYGIACAKGLAAGCARLASLLERGVGGVVDKKRAHSLRGKACKLGHSKSCASVKTTTSTSH